MIIILACFLGSRERVLSQALCGQGKCCIFRHTGPLTARHPTVSRWCLMCCRSRMSKSYSLRLSYIHCLSRRGKRAMSESCRHRFYFKLCELILHHLCSQIYLVHILSRLKDLTSVRKYAVMLYSSRFESLFPSGGLYMQRSVFNCLQEEPDKYAAIVDKWVCIASVVLFFNLRWFQIG